MPSKWTLHIESKINDQSIHPFIKVLFHLSIFILLSIHSLRCYSICPFSFYSSIYQGVIPSVHIPSIHPFIKVLFHLSIFLLSIHLSIKLSFHLSIFLLSIHPSIHLLTYMTTYHFIDKTTHSPPIRSKCITMTLDYFWS